MNKAELRLLAILAKTSKTEILSTVDTWKKGENYGALLNGVYTGQGKSAREAVGDAIFKAKGVLGITFSGEKLAVPTMYHPIPRKVTRFNQDNTAMPMPNAPKNQPVRKL